MEVYDRKAIFIELSDFCTHAGPDDYIEVTEWKNGEGYDVDIESKVKAHFQITIGEFDALKKAIKKLDK